MDGETTQTTTEGQTSTEQAGETTQAGQATQTQATQTGTQPTISMAELLDMRSKYESGLSGLSAKEQALKAEAEKLAPYRSLAERLEQAKEHPDLLVELLQERTGKSFQDLAKAVAGRSPTSPEAVQALAASKKLQAELAELRERDAQREVLAEVRPVLSDAKVAKLFELEGIAPETVVAGVRHLRAQGQKVDAADVVQKHAGYIRAKTLQMLQADPTILEEALKARDAAKAKAEADAKAKAAPPRAVPQGAQSATSTGAPLSRAEKRERAIALMRSK